MTRSEEDVRRDFAALDAEIARARAAGRLAPLPRLPSPARPPWTDAPVRDEPLRRRVAEALGEGPCPPRDALASARAARWASFAAHALGGLMAGTEEAPTGINWAKRAAELADELLAEHDARFSETRPAPPGAPAPRPGSRER